MPLALVVDSLSTAIPPDAARDAVVPAIQAGLKQLWTEIWRGSPWEPGAVMTSSPLTPGASESSRGDLDKLVAAPLGSGPKALRIATETAVKHACSTAQPEASSIKLVHLLEAAADHLQSHVGPNMGAHVVVVTDNLCNDFVIPEKVYSVLRAAWLRVHVMCIEGPSAAGGLGALPRLCAATGGSCLMLARGEDGAAWARATRRLANAHFPKFQATMHAGHLQGPVGLHPNPITNPLLAQSKMAPFPTTLAIAGFIDLIYLQCPPVKSQHALVGVSESEGGLGGGDSEGFPVPPSLPAVAALLRSVLTASSETDSGSPKDNPVRVPGEIPAAMVLLGPWAYSIDGQVPELAGETGGIGYITAELDERGGGHQLILTILDHEAVEGLPSLVGNEEFIPLDGTGMPCGCIQEVIPRSMAKIARYLKKTSENIDKVRAECERVRFTAALYGLEDSLQTLKQVLHDELISQEKMLRSSQERLQGLEDNTRGERKARSTYARPSAACEVRAEVYDD